MPNVSAELRRKVGGHPLVARILAQRGITTPEAARAFLDPHAYQPSDPFDLPDMEAARVMIISAIAEHRHILVYGDFDVDGQSSTAITWSALRALGAEADYRLPLRREGHGLHLATVEEAAQNGVSLLITCDTGVSDLEAVERANALGMQVIITDHHDLPARLPPAAALVNPKRLEQAHPCYQLSGAGVAWMLARALLQEPAGDPPLELADLAALGLIADVAYQTAEVRHIIQIGLDQLRTRPRPGLLALMALAQLEAGHVSSEDIGFQLAPRLNAAGRLGDPHIALDLLLSEDPLSAQALAAELEALNRDRQARTEATLRAAEERLLQEPELLHAPLIVVDGEGWESGIIGLVASSLVQHHQKPAIVISHCAGELSSASARSVEGIDIHALIAEQSDLLSGEGGHPMAAGFTIAPERVAFLRQRILASASRLPTAQRTPQLELSAQLDWGEISPSLARQLKRLAPYGPGNAAPLLLLPKGILLRSEDLSRHNPTPHRRLYCADDRGRQLAFVWFNAERRTMPEPGERIDIACTLGLDSWKGNERLRLELADWRAHADAPNAELVLYSGYEVIDQRRAADGPALEASLRETYGESLAIWQEGAANGEPAGVGRSALLRGGARALALAIRTPPCSPELLQCILEHVRPQVLVLLPPEPAPDYQAQEFILLVAGMVRSALLDPARAGRLDIERMAERLAARSEAIVATLCGLEASGVLALKAQDGILVASNPGVGPDEEAEDDAAPDELALGRQQAIRQAQQALLYQLRETRAYRAAYRSAPIDTWLVRPRQPAHGA
ncbi:MAG: single-stranded-DNA-specific exonuclease RecJ [Chloroflexi bacterium]|nr:single-stranded-DNA-specific exonuclease RecJ [Chloroflexota bacterium]